MLNFLCAGCVMPVSYFSPLYCDLSCHVLYIDSEIKFCSDVKLKLNFITGRLNVATFCEKIG